MKYFTIIRVFVYHIMTSEKEKQDRKKKTTDQSDDGKIFPTLTMITTSKQTISSSRKLIRNHEMRFRPLCRPIAFISCQDRSKKREKRFVKRREKLKHFHTVSLIPMEYSPGEAQVLLTPRLHRPTFTLSPPRSLFQGVSAAPVTPIPEHGWL